MTGKGRVETVRLRASFGRRSHFLSGSYPELMQVSPLLEPLSQRRLPVINYRGCDGVSRFPEEPDVEQAFGDAALFDFSWRSTLSVSGRDARRWLNGMVTANVRDLQPSHFAPSFALNPKGQIVAAFDVLCVAADEFLILADELQRTTLFTHLKRFIVVDKVVLNDSTDTLGHIAVRGKRATAIAASAGLSVPDQPLGAIVRDAAEASACPVESAALLRQIDGVDEIEILASPASLPDVWNSLRQAGAFQLGFDAQERSRILAGIPRYGADLGPDVLPQETGRLEAVSFTKGCYIGQEIVERIRSRGSVHRELTGIIFNAQVNAHAAVTAGGESVGHITSTTPLSSEHWAALAYIRRSAAAAGTSVVADGVGGTTAALPFSSELTR
jgi:aminomethyltransferase